MDEIVGRLNVIFSDSTRFDLTFSDKDKLNIVEFGEARMVDVRDHYTGPYIVEPSASQSFVLQTNNKVMDDNVTVNQIYSASVSNPAGGNTFYIASSLDE